MGHRVEDTHGTSWEDRSPLRHSYDHGQRVKRGQRVAVQQGRYGTGPAPYGYKRLNDSSGALVIDDREAEVVRIIFREYLRTRSTGKVVDYLHSRVFSRARETNGPGRQSPSYFPTAPIAGGFPMATLKRKACTNPLLSQPSSTRPMPSRKRRAGRASTGNSAVASLIFS